MTAAVHTDYTHLFPIKEGENDKYKSANEPRATRVSELTLYATLNDTSQSLE